MIHIYPDELVVDEQIFRAALTGDVLARRRLAFLIENEYCQERHATLCEGEMVVSLRDLTDAGVLDGVLIKVRQL